MSAVAGWEMSRWWRARSPWPDLPAFYTGDVHADDVTDLIGTHVNELVGSMASTQRARSYLAWHNYQLAAELHRRLVGDRDVHDVLLVDGFADCAARVSVALAITQHAAEQVIVQAVALRDRLPQVSERLREGRISPERVIAVIARTDLIDGADCAAEVDAQIAAELDVHDGPWSAERLRDMVDRIVYRHDPDAVRERRRRALDGRDAWVEAKADGVAKVAATMSAENARISRDSIVALAVTACGEDPRTIAQRRSDAAFALMSHTRFECLCGRDDCPAEIAEPGSGAASRIVIHVVADENTIAGQADNAGFVAGHGVISGEHVRDLAARPDAVVTPIVPPGTPRNPDGTWTVPAHQPADPYRPSAALDTYIRVRDGHSVVPGNATSAFVGDVDHVVEYHHADPSAGGQTVPENLNVKDRFFHILKTFGSWVDDQYRDRRGRLRQEFITPEGLVIPGDPDNLEVLFPGLRRIRFAPPPRAAGAADPRADDLAPDDQAPPTRPRSRLAAKYARRQQERERNRRRREQNEREGDEGD
ncbi:13E12 repeat family protein [Gordonia sp. OPL2]|uniref:13E12 repeat family protein n=1 Tax=Gordonia sp. OPL2 TaxID=2486274 RepID=UPI0021CCAACE|nr:13E12 repeat family protein [Gordonia sp. OPL2]